MTGSLQIKNEKFYIVLNITENGKRKQKWIATGLPTKGNKRKAEKCLHEILSNYNTTGQPANILFADQIRLWLKHAQRRVDPVTFQGYELMASTQVIPFFEERAVTLHNVTRELLQEFFDEKARCGRRDKTGGLSPASLRQFKNILNQTLNEAVKQGLIPSNPCQFIELPKKQPYASNYYTSDQLKQLFHAIHDDPLSSLIQITAIYGLRRSEVLGLKWDSIDFENNMITIKHTVSRVTTVVDKDKTKNSSSHRSFPLTAEAREIFLAAKGSEMEARNLCGKEYMENDYIFKWANGKRFSPDYVSSHFSLLPRKHNLPHIRFHELRHSCASLLLNSGYTLKDVQEYMGHADIQMTANIYGHLDHKRKMQLSETMSERLL